MIVHETIYYENNIWFYIFITTFRFTASFHKILITRSYHKILMVSSLLKKELIKGTKCM